MGDNIHSYFSAQPDDSAQISTDHAANYENLEMAMDVLNKH